MFTKHFTQSGWIRTACLVSLSAGLLIGSSQTKADTTPVSVEPQTLRGHSGMTQVFSVAFSPNNTMLAIGSRRRPNGSKGPNNNFIEITLWDVSSQRLVKTLEHGRSRNPVSVFVAFSPDGDILASASGEQIKLWDVRTGKLKRELEAPSATIRSITFASEGKTLTGTTANPASSWDVSWDVKSGRLLTTQKRDKTGVFSSHRDVFAGTNDSGVKLYDARTGQLRRTMAQVNYPVHSVAFSPDGKLLAGARASGVVRRGRTIQLANGRTIGVLSNDDKNNEETMWIWDVRTGKLLQPLAKHSWGVNAITFSSDGKWLASASDDGTVKLWRVE